MNPPLPHKLPPQFRESAFRRYEKTIKEILENHPSPTTVSYPGYSQQTTVSRLRDAIKSWQENKWKSKISYDKFFAIWPSMKVGIQTAANLDGSHKLNVVVECKFREGKKAPPKAVALDKGTLYGNILFKTITKEVLEACITIAESNLSKVTFHFDEQGCKDTIEAFEVPEGTDVSLFKNEEEFILI